MKFDRKALAWHIDRAILPMLVLSVGLSGILFHQQISTYVNTYLRETFDFGAFLMAAFVVLLVLGIIKLVGSGLEPYPGNSNAEGNSNAKSPNVGDDALTEYKSGNKLSGVYFKGSWTATSIFLPVCFGLVAVSYTEKILALTWEKMLPLAGASIFLYLYWWAYVNRYASYNRSIWKRLREIEAARKGMKLHSTIYKDDNRRSVRWRLKHVNFVLLVLLVALWGLRLYLSPLALPVQP